MQEHSTTAPACQHCGNPLSHDSHNPQRERKFCSRQCANGARTDTSPYGRHYFACCQQCGVAFRVLPKRKERARYCSHLCTRAAGRTHRGLPYAPVIEVSATHIGKVPNTPHKGQGQGWLDANGYRIVSVNGLPVREHRIIMAEIAGRPLTADEEVHHINGKRDDNRPENLQLMTVAEHKRLHAASRQPSDHLA